MKFPPKFHKVSFSQKENTFIMLIHKKLYDMLQFLTLESITMPFRGMDYNEMHQINNEYNH